MDPRIEAVRFPQSRKVAPGQHQRFLDGVLGHIAIVQHEQGNLVEPSDEFLRQRAECFSIAASGALHEILLHLCPHATACGAVDL